MMNIILDFIISKLSKTSVCIALLILCFGVGYLAGIQHADQKDKIKTLIQENKNLQIKQSQLTTTVKTMDNYYYELQSINQKYERLKNEANNLSSNLNSCRLTTEQLRFIQIAANNKVQDNSAARANEANAYATASDLFKLIPDYAEQYFECSNKLDKLQQIIVDYNHE